MLRKIKATFHNKSQQRRATIIGLLLGVMFILIITRVWAGIVLKYRTKAAIVPYVQTIVAVKADTPQHIILPGNISAWHEAPIYARTNGYLKTWHVDIGDHVKKNDLLAIIETPELNAQLRKAEADLNVVIAQNKLAIITAKRWINLLKSDSVSKQETDEKTHQAAALSASVVAAKANRDRLRELVGFERVIAPFTGVISYRGTDIGDLINEGSNPDAKPLFRIVQSDPLRLYIKIPELYTSQIKPNLSLFLTLAEHPGKRFKAHLLQTADAIDPKTRTLLAEFIVHNKAGELLPGSYTQVDLSIPTPSKSVVLPVNALIFRAEGLQVAIIDAEHRVQLKDISIAIDFGTHVALTYGIKPGESVIINPSDAIYQGQHVRIAHPHPNQTSGARKSAV